MATKSEEDRAFDVVSQDFELRRCEAAGGTVLGVFDRYCNIRKRVQFYIKALYKHP